MPSKAKSTKTSASTSSFSLEAVLAKTLGKDVKAKSAKTVEAEDDEDADEDEAGDEEEGAEDQWSDVDEEGDEDEEDEDEGEAQGGTSKREKVPTDINNTVALERIRDTIKLDPKLPWTETLVVSYPETIDVDVNDDLNRELAFYKQALHGANAARALAAKHKLPFTRPTDYFAEMVKSDAHMERIRQRLLDESATIKRSEEKRREREGKKFGKQVQMDKLREREKSKKDMEERLKGLKRKRKDALDGPQDEGGFDVAVEDAISDRPSKRTKGGDDRRSKLPRQARDQKFGFGGGNRRSKQNTKDSTDSFEPRRGGGKPTRGGRGGASSRGGGGGGRGRGGARSGGGQRPGKSRRMASRGRH